jgi:hypothetical protein
MLMLLHRLGSTGRALLSDDGQAITEYAIVVGALMAAIAAAITTGVGTAIVNTIVNAL